LREEARQAALDTTRKRLQLLQDYDRMRLTAPQLRARDQQTALDRAREDPPANEVWAGTSLNELLRSIKKVGRANLKTGPQIDLSDVSLENVNLTDLGGQGNVGMLKNTDREGNLQLGWPAAFETKEFAKTADSLNKSLSEAVAALKRKQRPERSTLKDIDEGFKALDKKLKDTATTDDLPPTQQIEARRFMKQLEQAIKALNDPKSVRYFDDWRAKGKTVTELVDHMMSNGLEFGPAASGDEAAYTALYQALRAYERGLQSSSKN